MRRVGHLEELQFHVYKGKGFDVDVVWWADTAKTIPMPISSARGKIQDGNTDEADDIIDLNPSHVDNRVIIRLSEETTSVDYKRGYLELEATSGTTTRVVARGPVVFHSEGSE